MKKSLISATLLIGMIASAMVFSSFTTSKESEEILTTQISVQDGWTKVGRYKGYKEGDSRPKLFTIWEKKSMCGSYYWTVDNNEDADPDKAYKSGQLRQNSEKQWYAAFGGDIYIIKGF